MTLPRHLGRRPVGDLDVRWADLRDDEVRREVTSRVRTVLDCARTLDFDEALAVADSALREGVVTRHELVHAVECSVRTGRARALRVAQGADGRAANPFESVVRAVALEVPGLSVEVPGVGWVDLLDRHLGLVIEAESFEFHGTRAGLARDVRRYTECTRRGLLVVRFTWEEAMFDAQHLHEVLTDVVALRNSSGSSTVHEALRAAPAAPGLRTA